MNFERFLEGVFPQLKGIAKQINGHLQFVDENDLMQEMSIHLWKKWKRGELEGKTKSYILQSCWFHLKNYLRTINEKTEIVSFEEPINGEGTTLGEIIPDNSRPLPELVNLKLLVEKIRANGLTKREKEVLSLYLKGCVLREIGKRMNISFVRVSKIKKNICRKLENEIGK